MSRRIRRRAALKTWWILLVVFLAACTPSGEETQETAPPPAAPPATSRPTPAGLPVDPTQTPQESIPDDRMVIIPESIPVVDLSLHTVPLSEIYFDTFQPVNRAVPLDRASPDLIIRLRDAIPPIHQPRYERASEAGWLNDQDMVIGYAAGDQAWAYPLRILNFHEIVNDFLAGQPVLISYCPLCYSGIVFSRQLGEQVLTFGNTSALYNSDMVMLDYQTGSYWWQVAGKAVVGELTDLQLTVLPSTTISWGQWRDLHPDTLVLSRDTGFSRNYERDPFGDYVEFINRGSFPFPVGEQARDQRLLPGDIVLAVKAGEKVRAYPVNALAGEAINDELGGQRLAVFIDPPGEGGFVYIPEWDGQPLSFEKQDGSIVDLETGTTWNLSGQGLAGELSGAQLTPWPSKTSFWFALVASEPSVEIWGP